MLSVIIEFNADFTPASCQKIHGVDVLLFGMYVYEYGDKCPQPNRRRVYISYLDSVHYLQPSAYRTLIYHTIICEYLRFVRARGFHTAHIWSCPPSEGDEYIFYRHPPQQLVPKDDMLRAWYVEALRKAQSEGIVLDVRTIYDEYFQDNVTNPETGEPFDPTDLPYFEGDYIPKEIEKIISEINRDEKMSKSTCNPNSKSNPSKCQKKEGKRLGTRSNPGDLFNQEKVMNRLEMTLSRMRQNFFVAQLLSDDFIKAVNLGEDVSSWREDIVSSCSNESKQIGKSPDVLIGQQSSYQGENSQHNMLSNVSSVVQSRNPIGQSENPSIPKVLVTPSSQVIGENTDEDPFMDQECIETRIAFLNFCQKKYLQFDELRRAKYSTMVLLRELHSRAEREHQLSIRLQVISHATSCTGCESKNCRFMKQQFKHVTACEVTYRNGCKMCRRLFSILTKHARDCTAQKCDIPFCDRIRNSRRRLLLQQQMLDDRRGDEQNDRHQESSLLF